MNTIGKLFTLTTFGESHGAAIGGVVDGMPAGIEVDMDFIQAELNRRRPGQSAITTSRQEPDQVELLSGVFEGKTTGCPIGFIVRMPISPIIINMVRATIVAEAAHRPASPSVASLQVPWPNWCCVSTASPFRPIPRKWATSP